MAKRIPPDQQLFLNLVANRLFEVYQSFPRGQRYEGFSNVLRSGPWYTRWMEAFPENAYATPERFESKIATHFSYIAAWRKCPRGVEYAMIENAYGQRRNWNETKAKYDGEG